MKQTCNLIAFDTHLLRKKKVITHAERCDSGGRKKARFVCVCVVTGKRIPAVDGSGAAAGKGFKLQPPSSSQRTCCWWCLWPADPTFTPPTLHPSPCSPPTPTMYPACFGSLPPTPGCRRVCGEVSDTEGIDTRCSFANLTTVRRSHFSRTQQQQGPSCAVWQIQASRRQTSALIFAV